MLSSSGDFLKCYLWKYVDISINKKDMVQLRNIIIVSEDLKELFNRFRNVLTNDLDVQNYVFVMSQIKDNIFVSFMTFYITYYQRCLNSSDKVKINNIKELSDFICYDEEKFKFLLISLYYYF